MRKSIAAFMTVSALSTASVAHAATCDATFLASLEAAEKIVFSLHPDKPAQARVFAGDLSVYTAGQAQWMRGELQAAVSACRRNEAATARQDLTEVRDLLRVHGRRQAIPSVS